MNKFITKTILSVAFIQFLVVTPALADIDWKVEPLLQKVIEKTIFDQNAARQDAGEYQKKEQENRGKMIDLQNKMFDKAFDAMKGGM